MRPQTTPRLGRAGRGFFHNAFGRGVQMWVLVGAAVAHLQRQEEQIHHDEGKRLKPLTRAAREPGGQNLLSLPQPPKSLVVSCLTSVSPMHGCVIGLFHAPPEVFFSFSIFLSPLHPSCRGKQRGSARGGGMGWKTSTIHPPNIPMLGIGERETNCSKTS